MDKKLQKEILEDVLESPPFKRSPSSCTLLKFLVEATLDNKDLKEATIGMELYGKSYEDEKSAANIRVNIYHLRKKLDKYYLEEGKDNDYRIKIKKGQYHVEFLKNKDDQPQEKSNQKKYYIAGGLVLAALAFWYFSSDKYVPLWNDYFDTNEGTTLFIGDFFGVMGTTATGSHGWNRDYNINNLEDYYRFLEQHPEKKEDIAPANYPYVTGMAATGTMNISRLFHRQNQDFNILFSSQTSIKDITETNSIYIGPIKNGNLFIDFFNDANPRISINRGMLSYTNPETEKDTLINLSIDDGSVYEHAVVSRFQGPNNKEQFIFFSDHDIGVKATTERFTDIDWVENKFKDMIGNHPHFTAIFLVKGKERTSMELELLLWDVLEE